MSSLVKVRSRHPTTKARRREASPSLRASADPSEPGEELRSVEECFAECNELPLLLAEACVGRLEARGALVQLGYVSKAFAQAVHEAKLGWCAHYEKQRDDWTCAALLASNGSRSEAERDDGRRVAYRRLRWLLGTLEKAFGPEFVREYGSFSRNLSVCTPLVYDSMASCRCAICRASMRARREHVPNGAARDAYTSYTFAHERCEHQHTVELVVDGWRRSDQRETLALDMRWRGRTAADRFRAIAAYGMDTLRIVPPETTRELVARMSLGVQLRNAHALVPPLQGAVWSTASAVLWLAPRPELVRRDDTIIGALGIPAAEVAYAIEAADEDRRKLAQVARERVRARVDDIRREMLAREGEVLLALGRHELGLPWCTIEEVARVHPLALQLVGIEALRSRLTGTHRSSLRGRPSPTAIIENLQHLHRLTGGPCPVSQQTIDYVLSQPGFFSRYRNLGADSPLPVMRAFDALNAHTASVESAWPILGEGYDQPSWQVAFRITVPVPKSRHNRSSLRSIVIVHSHTVHESQLMHWRAAIEDLSPCCTACSYARPIHTSTGRDAATETFVAKLLAEALRRPSCRGIALEILHVHLHIETLARDLSTTAAPC